MGRVTTTSLRAQENYLRAVLKSGKGVVPSKESSEETKQTASLLKSHAGGFITEIEGELLTSQEEESKVQGEKQEEKSDCGLQGAQDHNKGEDEPTTQEETENTISFTPVRTVSSKEVEVRGKNDGVGDPETTVRRESSSTEGVASRHFPVPARLVTNSAWRGGRCNRGTRALSQQATHNLK